MDLLELTPQEQARQAAQAAFRDLVAAGPPWVAEVHTLEDLRSLPAINQLSTYAFWHYEVPHLDQVQAFVDARPKVQQELRRIRTRIAARDALAAALGRPEGCFCLGLGPTWAYRVDSFPLYCPCPAGQEAEAADQERWKAARQRQWAVDWAAAEVPKKFVACTLDSYPRHTMNRATVERIQQWAERTLHTRDDGDADWWEDDPRYQGLYLHGPVGRGKTGLAVGVLRILLDAWVGAEEAPVLFVNLPMLLAERKAEFGQRDETTAAELWERALTVPVLVLDDLGCEYATDWTSEQIYVLLNTRLGAERITIYTSNLTPKELAEQYGQLHGERLVWRILEASMVEQVDGPNLRHRKGRQERDILAAAREVVAGIPDTEP
jgi:DNA replication protein DnaC